MGSIKYFGLITTLSIYCIDLILSYRISSKFMYNGLSLGINLAGLSVLIIILYVILNKLYSTNHVLVLTLFIVSTFLFLNFTLSSLADWVNNSSNFDNDVKGMSWTIVFPLIFILSMVWGWTFDKIKNKIIVKTN